MGLKMPEWFQLEGVCLHPSCQTTGNQQPAIETGQAAEMCSAAASYQLPTA